ncbi:hypothetical protein IPJ72_03965 [Candidatus Peregrinibacteria bacterium]|nr:MAG: hypothetical protein IPJ72_03965 [Candidatus Peregrinibacteria bacterium]
MDGNWSTPENWSGDVLPGLGDVVQFDGTSSKNADIDAGFSGEVQGVVFAAGYTGTVSQQAALTVGTAGWNQAAGTFQGGTQTIDVNGNVNGSGGSFTSTTGSLFVSGDFTLSGMTFSNAGGTLELDGASNANFTLGAAVPFANWVLNKTGGAALTLLGGSPVVDTVTLSGGQLNGGLLNINACQNATVTNGFTGGTATLNIVGGAGSWVIPADQTMPALTLNASGCSVLLSGVLVNTTTFQGAVLVQQGNLQLADTLAQFDSTLTNSGGTITTGVGSVVLNGAVSLTAGTIDFGTATSVDVNANVQIAGGAYTDSSTASSYSGNIDAQTGVYNPNGGTVTLDGLTNSDLIFASAYLFNNLTLAKQNPGSITITGATPIVANQLSATGGSLDSGTLIVQQCQNMNITNGFQGGVDHSQLLEEPETPRFLPINRCQAFN